MTSTVAVAGVPKPLVRLPNQSAASGRLQPGERVVAEEAAVAITYNRVTYAVMMATPADLEDFGIGFSLTEGVINRTDEVLELEIVPRDLGLELRVSLKDTAAERQARRRRRLAGPLGCGLCGIESLEEAVRDATPVESQLVVPAQRVVDAVRELPHAQWLNQEAHAVHAAAFWDGGIVALREDVGRHNALDKLAGALARGNRPAAGGMVLLTSRVSVEMVQKTARLGAPILVAVSAPTALAVRTAEACGITLVAVAREDSFEIFTRPERISGF